MVLGFGLVAKLTAIRIIFNVSTVASETADMQHIRPSLAVSCPDNVRRLKLRDPRGAMCRVLAHRGVGEVVGGISCGIGVQMRPDSPTLDRNAPPCWLCM